MKTTEEMIASTKRYIAKLEDARKEYESTLPAEGFLVTIDNIPITFDVKDGQYVNPRTEKPHKAIRFSVLEATRISKNITAHDTDGKEVCKGGVVHVWEAIAHWIASQRDLLSSLEAKTK